MKRMRGLIVSLMLFAIPIQPALAWSEGGHHLIAAMAFRMLKPEEQTVLIEILKSDGSMKKSVPIKLSN